LFREATTYFSLLALSTPRHQKSYTALHGTTYGTADMYQFVHIKKEYYELHGNDNSYNGFLKEDVFILHHYTGPFPNKALKKSKITKKFKTSVHLPKTFRHPFVTTAEAAAQSSPGTRANLHEVEAVEEGLLLGE
jgi:hypothetical protein